jgi:hypothetical protein
VFLEVRMCSREAQLVAGVTGTDIISADMCGCRWMEVLLFNHALACRDGGSGRSTLMLLFLLIPLAVVVTDGNALVTVIHNG